jgi:hypothetical protein
MEQTRVSDISYLGQDLFRCCPAYCCGSLEQRSWACWGSERDRHGPGTCQPSQVVRARRAAGVGLPTRAGMTKQNFGAWKQRVCRIVLIKTYAHRNLDNELCRLLSSRGARGAHDEGAWVRVGCGDGLLTRFGPWQRLPAVSQCASGTTVLSKVAKLPQMKPKGLASREEALGSCACAALARPTLSPQDNCTGPPPLRIATLGMCRQSRWHESARRWRGIA